MEDQNKPVAPQQPQQPQAPQQPQYAQPQYPQYAQPQYPQQPQYAQQQYPQYPQQSQYAPVKQTNGLGIAGFVVSLVALVLCWIPWVNGVLALTGVILSAIALRKKPKGLAIAGLIIGGLLIVVSIILIIYIVEEGPLLLFL